MAVQALKKLSNPRLRPETRRKLILDVITDEKLCFDLTMYSCFEKCSRHDKILVIKSLGFNYLYHAMNNTYHRNGNLKTVKLMLFFLAKNPETHMYFKYIISGYGDIKTILDNDELKTLFFKLVIKYNIRQAIIISFWPSNQHKIPDEFKDKLFALHIANKLSKGEN